MSSDAITPYDEERMSLSRLVESVAELESEPPDSGSDTASEIAFEQLLELLSVDSSADDDDNIILNFAHSSTLDQDIFEWQEGISAEPGSSLADLVIHTARVPVHSQVEMGRNRWPALRTHLSRAVSGPDCWIGLSVGEPQTNIVSFRQFGMVHWSHTPYVSFGSQYPLPQTFRCFRTPLGLFNDTAEPGRTSTVFCPHSLLPLPSS